MNHAPLAPSSAARTVACPGSVSLQLLHPQEETDETRAGDAAHWALSELLTGGDIDVGLVAPNGVTLDTEMVDAATMFADHIKARKLVAGRDVRVVEGRIANGSVHPDNWGTPDNVDYIGSILDGALYVDEFKYGHGFVDVFENWQALNYAILLLHGWMGNAWTSSTMPVTMTICQPRCYHRGGFIRTWTVEARQLVSYRVKLASAYKAAMQPNPPCIVSDECRDCTGRFDCEAALTAAQCAADGAYSAVPLQMSPQAKGVTLKRLQRAAKRLSAVITGLEADALATIGRGTRVPGYVGESGQGSTVWRDGVDDDDVKTMGDALGVSLATTKACTPIQGKAALKRAGLDPTLLDEYCEHRPGALKLVETSASATVRAFLKAK